jgi:hypothetical protein
LQKTKFFIRTQRTGTSDANITCMNVTKSLVLCSVASGGGILILGLGLGIAYLLFVLTGAIV